MVELNEYRQIVKNLLEEINNYGVSLYDDGVESQVVFDEAHDHYLLVDVGWNQKKYVYGSIIHLDIKDGKVWIQRNNTEINIAERLVEKGIPKGNIVIGFQSVFTRQFSGYALT
ncbi:XisI protein [Pseudanabaena galeata UHCC 0370]|uniref:XisI protein n=1 Tax=Pseudanabaena galeata UHCC 0370 TaxID=3110310 RepID=A0ABU5TLD3_9CYAN|nr:XisI protein [Pseudanabaena galeata]MEA5479086.1 XisI protein [Pseudanabaena galeata UHCC 0370]